VRCAQPVKPTGRKPQPYLLQRLEREPAESPDWLCDLKRLRWYQPWGPAPRFSHEQSPPSPIFASSAGASGIRFSPPAGDSTQTAGATPEGTGWSKWMTISSGHRER
jgi:hypothetical protein